MPTKLLSTGEAAKLCSVTPDTVLKWIHSGRLPARRTAGGHHRVREEDLKRFFLLEQPPNAVVAVSSTPRDRRADRGGEKVRYCWEHNNPGEVPEGCLNCIVYQLRAQRCYEVAEHHPELGHTKLFCQGNCQECDYYRRVHLQPTNVLVVTDDPKLTESLRRSRTEAPYNVEITDCEYRCSALVDSYRPDFVVVDCSMGAEKSGDICSHLMEDPRLPLVRVVLAVDAARTADVPPTCDRSVFARIERPFRISDITDFIHRARH